MSSGRVQTSLIGVPVALEISAASITKSHFDLRPNPPPSSVTLTVTLSSGRSSTFARSARQPPGLCTGAQAMHLPPLTCTVAFGGSMLAWAKCGA